MESYDQLLLQTRRKNSFLSHIQLKTDAAPKFFKLRPIPFAHLEGMRDEIHREVEASILERTNTSLRAPTIVSVKKSNAKIRIYDIW